MLQRNQAVKRLSRVVQMCSRAQNPDDYLLLTTLHCSTSLSTIWTNVFLKTDFFLSNLTNVFVCITKCICINWRMYFFKVPNVFATQLATCFALHHHLDRARFTKNLSAWLIFFPIVSSWFITGSKGGLPAKNLHKKINPKVMRFHPCLTCAWCYCLY